MCIIGERRYPGSSLESHRKRKLPGCRWDPPRISCLSCPIIQLQMSSDGGRTLFDSFGLSDGTPERLVGVVRPPGAAAGLGSGRAGIPTS